MDASGEREARGTRAERPDRTGQRSAAVRKLAATGGWLCAIVVAVLVGTWSFQNANPDAGYASHGPLDEGDVREELADGGTGIPEKPGTTAPPERPSGPPSSSSAEPPDESSPPPRTEPPADRGAPPVPLEIPQGGATATVQCLDDGRIRLTGLSPADGFRVDDVVHGPGRLVSFELKPPDDNEEGESEHEEDDAVSVRSATAKGPEDRIVKAHCRGGEPVTSVTGESRDTADD